MTKKLSLPSELAYVIAVLILSFSVSMITAANFGVSMIVAPAYILSLKTGISFGHCEYILQSGVFVLLCILMRKIKLVYFASFVTCLIYGAVLDMWRKIIPWFNPQIIAPGSFPMAVRIVFFTVGVIMTSFSIALFFKTYLYPQVYDFFVKAISERYSLNRTKFKRIFDATCFGVAVLMTLVFFGRFNGVGVGTVIMTVVNGIIIGFFDRHMDNVFTFVPIFKRLSQQFKIL